MKIKKDKNIFSVEELSQYETDFSKTADYF